MISHCMYGTEEQVDDGGDYWRQARKLLVGSLIKGLLIPGAISSAMIVGNKTTIKVWIKFGLKRP